MKNEVFGVLQRVGRSFMLPIAVLPVAGLLLGLGSSFTNPTTIETYGMEALLGQGTVLHALLMIMNAVGSAIFDNLPLIFAIGVAIGMAKKEKEVAALSAMLAYFVMNVSVQAMLMLFGRIDADGNLAADVMEGTITNMCGIQTLQMGVFGGVIVGLGVAALNNRFHKIELPGAISFFSGSRFVPIISTVVYMLVGIVMFFVWPTVQNGISGLGMLVAGSGYIGTLIFGIVKRALIPFGLHHVFYMPFWQTGVGGTMDVAGHTVQGGQNIFFAQLADSANIAHFSADACRYFSGEFIFMMFGLPGAALAMYRCARPEKRKQVGGLLLSATLASIFTGITEPIEFSFLFAAPVLFAVQVVLAGSCYMVAHMLKIAIGLTFSGGFLDFLLFGILQGNAKTGWMLVLPAGAVCFLLYYCSFSYLIRRFDLKTPGRELDANTKLYSKADYLAKKAGQTVAAPTDEEDDPVSRILMNGLGGKANISDVDCCATRLRVTVKDSSRVRDEILKEAGPSGIVHRGNGIQVVFGPRVTVIKANLEDYLEKMPDTWFTGESNADRTAEGAGEASAKPENGANAGKTENDASGTSDASAKPAKTIVIGSPITGQAADLSATPDEGFASGMMGEGAALTPTEGTVCAPTDGTVSFIFDTKHAVGFTTDSGIEMLFHIGIDTVKLNGEGFEILVQQGQELKKGDPIMKLDLDYLKAHAPSIVSPILCTDLEDDQKVRRLAEGPVKAGDDLIAVDIYES